VHAATPYPPEQALSFENDMSKREKDEPSQTGAFFYCHLNEGGGNPVIYIFHVIFKFFFVYDSAAI
jgi:hypothetical protein